jgi:hypothetical protein
MKRTNTNSCSHIGSLHELKKPKAYICEECIKQGGEWVHLRTCQTCGVTLCCDSSPHKHMTKHYLHSNHPVITSAEPGEQWIWCYKDEQLVAY